MYYFHDKQAQSRERVGWTQTRNLLTDDVDKAWRVMAHTALTYEDLKRASGQDMRGSKLKKPVFAYSLSWHPEQKPSREHMEAMAFKSMDHLDLSDHEAMIVCHRDEEHPHVHVIVNTVHPVTGKVAPVKDSKDRMQEFASDYERQTKIYCQQREDNRAYKEQGKRTRYCDPVIKEAWEQSDCGRSFVTALAARGYALAQGRKRLVVVDPHGKAINPVRHLDGVKARQFQERLSDLDFDKLPDAKQVQPKVNRRNRVDYDYQQHYRKVTAKTLNDQQDRQQAERSALFDKHHSRIERDKLQLGEYYELQSKQKEMRRLETQLANPTIFQRLTGKDKRLRDDLERMQLTLKNAQQRFDERLEAVTRERDEALKALSERQRQEREELRARMQTRGPRRRRHDPCPDWAREREHMRQREIWHIPKGPER